MNNIYTKTGKSFRNLEYSEAKNLEVGEKVLISLWTNEEHTKLELISSVVTKAAYYNADCDEPDWEIETSNGAVDLYGLWVPLD